MGGIISNLKRNSENEDELKIRKYEEDLANDSFGEAFEGKI